MPQPLTPSDGQAGKLATSQSPFDGAIPEQEKTMPQVELLQDFRPNFVPFVFDFPVSQEESQKTNEYLEFLKKFNSYEELVRYTSNVNLGKNNVELHLSGTGFDVDRQTASFLNDYINGIKNGKSIDEIIRESTSKIKQDLAGFYFEFLAREPILIVPGDLEDGELVSNKYGGARLRDITDRKQRNGAVGAVIDALCDALPIAPENSMFVITSPMGWAETNESGETTKFPESQTYMYKLGKNGVLQAISVRNDGTLSQHEKLLEILSEGQYPAPDGYIDRLISLSSTLIYLPGDETDYSFEDILQIMQIAFGTNLAWTDQRTKAVTFDDLIEKAKKIDDLQKLDTKVEVIIEQFSREMESFETIESEEDVARLMRLLGKTALIISYAYRNKGNNTTKTDTGYAHTTLLKTPYDEINLHQEAKFVQQQRGCVGVSSGNSTWQNTALGQRLFQNGEEIKEGETDPDVLSGAYFRCPGCKGKIKSGEGTTTCPHCGMTKEQAGSKCV